MIQRYTLVSDIWKSKGRPDISPHPIDPPLTLTPPTGFTHGADLGATYDLARQQIGTSGVLTEMSARHFTNGEVIENRLINGQTTYEGRVIFNNCKFVRGASAAGATIFAINSGSYATLNNCEVVRRLMRGDGNSAITARSGASLELKKTIIRGGYDQMFLSPPNSPGLIPTGDPLVPMAQILVEDCWIGDNERTAGSHSDLMQIDNNLATDKGYVVVRRSRFAGFSLKPGQDPLTSWVTNQSNATMASTGIITTGAIGGHYRVAIRDNFFEGGNIIVQVILKDSAITGNKFGLRMQYSPLSTGSSSNLTVSNNTWAYSGTTGYGLSVTAGQPVS